MQHEKSSQPRTAGYFKGEIPTEKRPFCCIEVAPCCSHYFIQPFIGQDILNYDVDSDDEWEEEEPGESLSNSEVIVLIM